VDRADVIIIYVRHAEGLALLLEQRGGLMNDKFDLKSGRTTR
jgi:hypothetical protein